MRFTGNAVEPFLGTLWAEDRFGEWDHQALDFTQGRMLEAFRRKCAKKPFWDVVLYTHRHEEVLSRGALLQSTGVIADSAALVAMTRGRSKRSLAGINH